MDSTSLVVQKLSEGYIVHAVSFDYGQKHVIELERLQENIDYFEQNGIFVEHCQITIQKNYRSRQASEHYKNHSALIQGGEDIPEGYYEESNMKKTVVSNRNATFFSHLYAEAHQYAITNQVPVEISLGVHSGDHAIYPDCRSEFYEQFFPATSIGNYQPELVTLSLPYIDGDKALILRQALVACEQLGLDFDTVFRNTNTCYAPDEKGRSTGRTGADVERILAFYEINRVDPVPYVDSWDTVLQFALDAQAKFEQQHSS